MHEHTKAGISEPIGAGIVVSGYGGAQAKDTGYRYDYCEKNTALFLHRVNSNWLNESLAMRFYSQISPIGLVRLIGLIWERPFIIKHR
jgi:hypothetical protein